MRLVFCLVLLFVDQSYAIRGEVEPLTSEVYMLASISAVELFKADTDEPFCSGSVISESQVLTAAHCFDSGIKNIYLKINDQKVFVEEILINTDYRRVEVYDPTWGYLYEIRLENDFALLNVSDHSFNSFIKLKEKFVPIEEEPVYLAGFGATFSMLGHSVGAGVFRVSKPSIAKEYTVFGFELNDGASGACLGDSGGPAIIVGPDFKLIQVGLVSTSDCQVVTRVQKVSLEILETASYRSYF